MITPKPPVDSTNEIIELRAELAALRARVAQIEALLLFVHGSQALGSASPAPPPPAEPPRIKAIATIAHPFSGS